MRPFEECFDRGGDDECWLWTGSRNSRGYGLFYVGEVNGKTKMVLAHRLAWQRMNGPIPEHDSTHGMCVCHRCDVRLCVNPSHLFLGTQRENMHDKLRKGRSGIERFTQAQVHDALERLANGGTFGEVSAATGMSVRYLEKVLYERTRVLVPDDLIERAKAGRKRTVNRSNARVNEALVRELRAKYVRGVYGAERLAKEYGLPDSTVREIVTRQTWKDVD